MIDYLLVPTNVQAFAVGKPGEQVFDLAPVPLTEDDVANWFVERKYSFSFQNKLSSLEPGIHLHWALPDALTHSIHQDTGDSGQPCIPNRWLVVRMWHAAGDSTISSKAWVVESDYVCLDAARGGTPFFFGTNPPAELNGKHCGYVGRTVPADDWRETHEKYRFDLTSFGWGDPSFAAYYPACRGILGFHDTIAMDEVAKDDLLTYLVTGWYSDPAMDPLQQESDDDLLASLRWSCPNLADAALPQRTLCHGAVVNMQWQGGNQKYPQVSDGSTPASVAIGGSAAEALAALLAPEQKSLQQVLCAFQHGQATQVSRLDQLGDLLHRHGFGALPGGKLWSIQAVDSSPADPATGATASPSPVSARIQNLLGKLNEAQRALDWQARRVESLGWRSFACWATWASKQIGPPGKRPSRDPVESVTAAFQVASKNLLDYEEAVRACENDVAAAIKAEDTDMQLTESTMPPFLYPKDPFLVLADDHLVGVERTREQRPDSDADNSLNCRLAKGIVTGLTHSGNTSREWLAKNCFTLNFFDVTGVPPGEVAKTLALEALLFDTNCSRLIDTNDESFDLDLFEAIQESFDPKREHGGNTLAWNAQPPDPLAITRWCDRNPWLPAYLMWQARWVPAQTHGLDSSGGEQVACEFDSDPLSGDLPWPNDESMQSSGDGVRLEGATMISPLSGNHLATSLRDYVEAAGGETGNLQRIEQTQVLGQSLGGFNDLLLRQTLGLCLPPVDPISKQFDREIWEAMGKGPLPVMPATGAFLPVRAGALKLVNLFVVDSFGQTRKLIDHASTSDVPPPRVIASAALPPPPDGYHAGFSRRLVPPARLNFDWQSAEEASGPVCGWIVANFLDKSFAVFGADGTPLGVLESVLPSLGKKSIESPMQFKWLAVPGSTLAIEGIENSRLRRFVKLVTSFSADEGAVFLELVDLVLRRTVGRIPAEDPAMTVLMGRPLALAHASLELEIQGLPAGYWSTDGEWEFETEALEKLRVPVLLGGMNLPSDGLVGYLPDDDESSFFASEGATRRPISNKKIEYGQSLSVASADESPVSLTLLMDVNAPVHATTGILPRHSVSLPSEDVHLARLIQEIYIGVAPVLGERPRETAAQPVMPQPSDAFGQWSWATRPDLTGTPQTWHDIRPADDRARFGSDLALTEGWLRLRRNPGDASADHNP